MSGAPGPDIQGLSAPWSSTDVEKTSENLRSLSTVNSLIRRGEKAKSRTELTKLREAHKGTPQEALVDFLMKSDDYSDALDQAIRHVRSTNAATDPIEPPEQTPGAQPTNVAAWEGQGGPEDMSQVYAQSVDDADTEALLREADEAYVEAEGGEQQQAKVSPRPGSVRGGAEAAAKEVDALRVRPSTSGDFISTAGDVASDIAVGLGESPRAVVSGLQNAAHELLSSIDSAGAWVAVNAAQALGDDGTAKNIEASREKGAQVLGGIVTESGAMRSTTGSLVQGVTQFIAGFAAGGKTLEALGLLGRLGKTGDVFLKAGFSDAFAFDPAQERLSNLVESVPELNNPVTEFLQTKPGDSEAMGRLKGTLEGLGIGGAMQAAFMTALKGFRAVRGLNPPPPTPEQIATHVREGLAPLGTAEGEMVSARTLSVDDVTNLVTPQVKGKEPPGTITISSAKKDLEAAGADRELFSKTFAKGAYAVMRDGKPIARLRGFVGTADGQTKVGGDTFYIAHVDTPNGAANTLGPKAMRDAMKALANDLPSNVKYIAGQRISGARIKSADLRGDDMIVDNGQYVRVPLDRGEPFAPVGAITADGLVSAGKAADGKDVFINFARIEAGDDVKALIQNTANQFKGSIKEAQRGVQSQELTQSLADDLGMSVEQLTSRRRAPNGARAPFTAEEALAARRLYTASGSKLMELAQKASSPNAGQIDLFNFRKMMATHYAIQQEVIGARTETARALASWKIPAGAGPTQLRMIEQAMEAAGADSVRMANELVRMNAAGASPADVGKYVRKSAFGTFVQGVREVYVNGLLSNPLTHIVNTTGNVMTALLSVTERGVARQVSRAVTGSDAVAAGEAAAMLHGLIEGQKDGFRLAWKTLRTGETTDLLGKVDAARPVAIASSRNDAFGKATNALGAVIRTPSLLMGTADQYFKAINYRANLHSYAVRQAASEGLSGKPAAARVTQILNDPPESLRIESADAALYNTFNNSMGEFGKVLMSLREHGGPLNATWLIAPFIRTPVNIARYAFERTPLAPLVGQWRADIAAGGARRDIAIARTATGTVVMGIAQQLAANGQVTGSLPEDANEAALWKREGRAPYSVKIGDAWYSFSRADPFGMTMGFAADMQQTLSRGDIAPDDIDEWTEVMAGGISAVSNTVMEKTFLRGFSQFNDMLADPKRYGPKEINSILAGFIPFSALGGAVNRAMDPTIRDVKTPLEAVYARIPWLAQRIIPRRDLWGEVETDDANLFNAFSPFRASTEDASPIDKEMSRLGVYPQGIGWKTSIDGVAVNFSNDPQALDEYRRLAGNGYKHPAWGVGLKDFLDQTVSGSGIMSGVYRLYSDGEHGGKAAFIRKAIQDYREMAGRALLSDRNFASFRAYYEEEAAAQRQAKQRVNIN